MITILKALRDVLVADATLTALVPAANIYAGVRDEKTPVPAIDVFSLVGPEPDRYAGAKCGGMTDITEAFQVSIFHNTEAEAQVVKNRVMAVMLGANTTLNTAKIKNVVLMNAAPSLMELNISHIPLRFRCNYHVKIG